MTQTNHTVAQMIAAVGWEAGGGAGRAAGRRPMAAGEAARAPRARLHRCAGGLLANAVARSDSRDGYPTFAAPGAGFDSRGRLSYVRSVYSVGQRDSQILNSSWMPLASARGR